MKRDQNKEKTKLSKEQQQMIDVFVKTLPSLRKEFGVSQTALGEKIGISRQMVSYIERGVYPMTWGTFLSIALFFKVNYYRNKEQLNDLDKFLLIDIGEQKSSD